MGDERVPWGGAEGFDWEAVDDLAALSAGELRGGLRR
jgi:hypothetical protein